MKNKGKSNLIKFTDDILFQRKVGADKHYFYKTMVKILL